MMRAVAGVLAFYGVQVALFLLAAGRFDLPAFWAYAALLVGSSVALLPVLERRSPGLIEERTHPGPGAQERLSLPLMMIGMLGIWIVSGLDSGRFHWSGRLPAAVQAVAWAGVLAGLALMAWAMLVNRFFSSAVRIQADRGHVLVTAGPYAAIRHPGYAGGLLFLACTGIALGSWWALLPALLALFGVLRRTVIEDAMLRRELEGYAGYADRVRFRLVPGVW